MKDIKGGDKFDWSDLKSGNPYPLELIGEWIKKAPRREQSMAFFQECSDVLLKEGSLPVDWQRYLVYLMQNASKTVLNNESARKSKLAKVLGLSAGRDLTGRNGMIAYAVHHRVCKGWKVEGACSDGYMLLICWHWSGGYPLP